MGTGQPTDLFQSESDAVWYLAGLGGFWAGFAFVWVVWLTGAPGSLLLVGLAVLLCGWLALSRSTRKLEERITGRHVRPWPFGYPGFRAQIHATLPATVTAAAKRLGLNVLLVITVVYGLLAIDLIAFLTTWALRR